MTCRSLRLRWGTRVFPFEVHQLKHYISCCMAPVGLANKNPWLQSSSAFLNESLLPLVKCLSLVPFVVSFLLREGVWLLQHLRPLFRALAFSHPFSGKAAPPSRARARRRRRRGSARRAPRRTLP